MAPTLNDRDGAVTVSKRFTGDSSFGAGKQPARDVGYYRVPQPAEGYGKYPGLNKSEKSLAEATRDDTGRPRISSVDFSRELCV